MQERLRHYALDPQGIEQRLQELDQEWDIERTLEPMPPVSPWRALPWE